MARFKIEGLKEVDRVLADVPQSTGKRAMRKALIFAGQPTAREARRNARVRNADLQESIDVSSTARPRPKPIFRSDVEVYIGPGQLVQALTEEFGTPDQAPENNLREAWDKTRDRVLERAGVGIFDEVELVVQRRAKRQSVT